MWSSQCQCLTRQGLNAVLALSNHWNSLSKSSQLQCYAWSMALSSGCKAKGLWKLMSGAGACYCCSKPCMLRMYMGDTFPVPTFLHPLRNAGVNYFILTSSGFCCCCCCWVSLFIIQQDLWSKTQIPIGVSHLCDLPVHLGLNCFIFSVFRL